jgi:hypothetical protein
VSILRVGPRLTEAITVKRITGHTSGGDPVRATTITMNARVQRADQDQPLSGGRDAASSTLVFTTTAILMGDLVFLPEDNPADQETGRLVSSVDKRVALDGTVTHYVASI